VINVGELEERKVWVEGERRGEGLALGTKRVETRQKKVRAVSSRVDKLERERRTASTTIAMSRLSITDALPDCRLMVRLIRYGSLTITPSAHYLAQLIV
jgi:hypothetical protein